MAEFPYYSHLESVRYTKKLLYGNVLTIEFVRQL